MLRCCGAVSEHLEACAAHPLLCGAACHQSQQGRSGLLTRHVFHQPGSAKQRTLHSPWPAKFADSPASGSSPDQNERQVRAPPRPTRHACPRHRQDWLACSATTSCRLLLLLLERGRQDHWEGRAGQHVVQLKALHAQPHTLVGCECEGGRGAGGAAGRVGDAQGSGRWMAAVGRKEFAAWMKVLILHAQQNLRKKAEIQSKARRAAPPEAGLLPSTRLALSSAALSSSSSRALWSTWGQQCFGSCRQFAKRQRRPATLFRQPLRKAVQRWM